MLSIPIVFRCTVFREQITVYYLRKKYVVVESGAVADKTYPTFLMCIFETNILLSGKDLPFFSNIQFEQINFLASKQLLSSSNWATILNWFR